MRISLLAKEMKTKEPFTPLMKQYHQIKSKYKDAIVLFRLGDFYEMFGEDAIKCAPILNIVLTKRQGYPMCGVPFHSVNNYISKLINSGFKVAICEQLEEPSKAKGLVKRDVIRLITPGTVLEENLLETERNNFLLSIYISDKSIGIAYVDISTGEFCCTEFQDDNKLTKLHSEISRLRPQEFLIPKSLHETNFDFNGKLVNRLDDYYFSYLYADEKLRSVFQVLSLSSLGLADKHSATSACGAILYYLENTQKKIYETINKVRYYTFEEYMLLDESAIRNLELVEGCLTRTKENSLLEIIDKTSTPLGSRLMRKNLLRPLTNVEKINRRLDAVEFFVNEGLLRRKIKEKLKLIRDMERIISRVSSRLATPQDLLLLKESLKQIPEIKSEIERSIQGYTSIPYNILDINSRLHDLKTLTELIGSAIVPEPPADIHNGGFIKDGYSPELDEIRRILVNGRNFIASLEKKERERTGIQSLKIGYTSVFGYYIEVTKPNLHLVPKDYIRKQTLVNSERFITAELKEYEDKVLSAEEKSIELEMKIFNDLINEVLKHSTQIKEVAESIAELDFYLSLAEVAIENNYVKPTVRDDNVLLITGGRHPVVEKKLKGKTFVPNDLYLDGSESQIIILTGPNMAGKSTYLKQAALIVILAQMGSFVPATSARIGVVDRIFTRIGAAEDLAGGASTFMVEMQEVANIINNSTPKSLLILDEVGRGTSTYDGISIAWATVEYLLKKENQEYGPKVLFATHYFELTELSKLSPLIKNMNVLVKEYKDEIIFLHKVVPGPSDKSYGIHVAKLAGLPKELISTAKRIFRKLESRSKEASPQKELDFETPLERELEAININEISPMEALRILSQLKEKLK